MICSLAKILKVATFLLKISKFPLRSIYKVTIVPSCSLEKAMASCYSNLTFVP